VLFEKYFVHETKQRISEPLYENHALRTPGGRQESGHCRAANGRAQGALYFAWPVAQSNCAEGKQEELPERSWTAGFTLNDGRWCNW
jgi:hypothetical protein